MESLYFHSFFSMHNQKTPRIWGTKNGVTEPHKPILGVGFPYMSLAYSLHIIGFRTSILGAWNLSQWSYMRLRKKTHQTQSLVSPPLQKPKPRSTGDFPSNAPMRPENLDGVKKSLANKMSLGLLSMGLFGITWINEDFRHFLHARTLRKTTIAPKNDPSWTKFTKSCDVHIIAQVHLRTSGLLDNDISGLLHTSLAQHGAGALQSLRDILQTMVFFRIGSGVWHPTARAHSCSTPTGPRPVPTTWWISLFGGFQLHNAFAQVHLGPYAQRGPRGRRDHTLLHVWLLQGLWWHNEQNVLLCGLGIVAW